MKKGQLLMNKYHFDNQKWYTIWVQFEPMGSVGYYDTKQLVY